MRIHKKLYHYTPDAPTILTLMITWLVYMGLYATFSCFYSMHTFFLPYNNLAFEYRPAKSSRGLVIGFQMLALAGMKSRSMSTGVQSTSSKFPRIVTYCSAYGSA